MKKFKSFYMMAALLMAAVAFGFSSCSDDDDVEGGGSKSDLIGTWESVYYLEVYKEDGEEVDRYEDYDNTLRLKFDADGTCASAEYYNGRWDWDVEGTWSYKNGKISITYYDEEDDEKYTETATVKTLTSTKLIIEQTDKYTEDGVKCEDYYYEEYKKISD